MVVHRTTTAPTNRRVLTASSRLLHSNDDHHHHRHYRWFSTGSVGSIFNPPRYELPVSPEVKDCIWAKIAGGGIGDDSEEATQQEQKQKLPMDTGMSVLFLGTSAGLPSKARSPTSTLLRLGGESILIDAGEGTQRQLMFTRARIGQIDKIFITHLHGDHIFGLPGLILGLQHSQQVNVMAQKQSKKTLSSPPSSRTIQIYGPPGLYNYIAANIVLSCTMIHAMDLQVFELVGGRVRRTHHHQGRPSTNRRGDMRNITNNPFATEYPEFQVGRMTRHEIPCGPDGIWTIQDLPPLMTREDIMAKKDGRFRHTQTGDKSRFRIQAAEVDHLSGVVTFGYSIQEEEPPLNLDAVKAQALGVSSADLKYSLLKAGFSVWTDDGSRQVQPAEVCTTRRKKARKITVVGDNRGWTPSMKRIAQDCDVLVHEATLMEKEDDWHKRGHSTPEMAGQVSGQVNAKLLILNHISPKADYHDQNDGSTAQLTLIEKAKQASQGISEVIVAYDFMEVMVPWLGFGKAAGSGGEEQPQETTAGSGGEEQPQETIQDTQEPTPDTPKPQKSSKDELVDPKEVLHEWFGPKNP